MLEPLLPVVAKGITRDNLGRAARALGVGFGLSAPSRESRFDRGMVGALSLGAFALGTTGDGIATGLRLISRMAETGRSLAELAAAMRTLPQVLINVPVADKDTVAATDDVQAAVRAAEDTLGDEGRILLRPSGTEQLVRVMVEAGDADTARTLAERVAAVVGAHS